MRKLFLAISIVLLIVISGEVLNVGAQEPPVRYQVSSCSGYLWILNYTADPLYVTWRSTNYIPFGLEVGPYSASPLSLTPYVGIEIVASQIYGNVIPHLFAYSTMPCTFEWPHPPSNVYVSPPPTPVCPNLPRFAPGQIVTAVLNSPMWTFGTTDPAFSEEVGIGIDAEQNARVLGTTCDANGQNFVQVEKAIGTHFGQLGYVPENILVLNPNIAASPPLPMDYSSTVPIGVVVASLRVNVRALQSINSNVIGHLVSGDVVRVLEVSHNGRWASVVTPDGVYGNVCLNLFMPNFYHAFTAVVPGLTYAASPPRVGPIVPPGLAEPEDCTGHVAY